MKNCIIAQSGGPTVAINASLSGVIEAALSSNQIDNVYGALHGIEGVIHNHFLDLGKIFKEETNGLALLRNTPAMFLGSCRYKLPKPEAAPELYEQLFCFFEAHHIAYFFYIGGNDSMDTVHKLSDYASSIQAKVQFIGIPKTIDNDLVGTDHTPGFGSAAKYVATSLLEIAHDTYIYNLKSVTIVEIMGRNAGWLTAASALAIHEHSNAPDLIYLPESAFSKDAFIETLRKLLTIKDNIIVAVSEGLKDANGQYIAASDNSKTDQFGHAQLSGVGKTLESLVAHTIGCKVRSIELNVLQRSAMHCASLTDIEESAQAGRESVAYAINGATGVMVTMSRREDDANYLIEYHCSDISQIANQEKIVPPHWITPTKDGITDDFMNYLRPLIQGEPTIIYKNGLPHYLSKAMYPAAYISLQ